VKVTQAGRAQPIEALRFKSRPELAVLGDVSVDVDATRATAEPGIVGVVCRMDAGGQSFYAGAIEPNGTWTIIRVASGTFSNVDQGSAAGIRSGTAANHVRLECSGQGAATKVTLRVNGAAVGQSADAAGLPPGRVGVFAGNLEGACCIEALFDNFVAGRLQ
jgi:hypothetical protein